MKGYELFNKAILRLGYSDATKDNLFPRAKELINQILLDLNCETIDSLFDRLPCDNKVSEGVCCGVAMLMALSEADEEKHKMFCQLYNAKRSGILSKTAIVEDKMPIAEGGEF